MNEYDKIFYRFQFLGIPPKGEQGLIDLAAVLGGGLTFPISRDPPEGGTIESVPKFFSIISPSVSNF